MKKFNICNPFNLELAKKNYAMELWDFRITESVITIELVEPTVYYENHYTYPDLAIVVGKSLQDKRYVAFPYQLSMKQLNND